MRNLCGGFGVSQNMHLTAVPSAPTNPQGKWRIEPSTKKPALVRRAGNRRFNFYN